jgi:CARDB
MSARSLRRVVGVAALVAIALIVPFAAAQEIHDCSDADNVECDLAVSATSTLPDPDHVEVRVTVSNIGDGQSFDTQLTITAGGDWEIHEETVGPLQAGESREFPATFDIPASARGMQATFQVEVAELIGEGEKGPNETSTSIDIPPAEPAPLPDLLLLPADVTATVVDGGDRVTIRGLVRNAGEATAQPITVRARAPGWEEEPTTLQGGIERDGSRDFTIVLETPDGQRGTSVEFHVAVEPVRGEKETENNGIDTGRVEIPGPDLPERKPDLAVASADARVAADGQSVEVAGVIRNGGDDTSEDLGLSVSAPGWNTKSKSLPGGLSKGGTRAFSFVVDIPQAAFGADVAFHVEVDPVDGEENVVNNKLDTAPVTVPPLPPADEGSDFPWPIVIGIGALLLAAAGIVGWQLARRSRVPQPEPTPRGAEPEPIEPGGEEPIVLPRAERVVNTGFSSEWGSGTPLPPNVSLVPSTSYLFWLEIGGLVAGSIEETPTELPPGLAADAELTVAVFALDDNLALANGADVGELRLRADGATVTHPAAREVAVPPGSKLDLRRLFFRVRTGDRPGTGRLRCNIYYRQVLVQARLITAEVRTASTRIDGALRSVVDYNVAPSLDPARLAQLEPHRLSVLVNESSDGTHDFYFLGQEAFKSSASFQGQELQNLISSARGVLRRAAWGDLGEWVDGKAYRYEGFDLERLQLDLVRFALSGYRFYDAIINRLAGGYDDVAPLATLMLQPGLVQIASKESPGHVIPAALIYDYPLDTSATLEEYELCSTAAAALVNERPLADTPCFRGECPNRAAATVVCPSGFWGYRHALGMPVSVAGTAPDLPNEIGYTDGPHLVVAVSTDPAFVLRGRHEQALRGLRAGLGWHYANTRDQAVALLKEGKAEVVYFYCHGGVAGEVPFIQVGPLDARGITRDAFRREQIRWSSPRPLVFINGCHTTALEPEKAIEFVSALIENAQASGVIGTEITVFEPLASAFAEECLRRFLDGEPLGAAVRNARLALLSAGNPLGLVYIPFAMTNLRLRGSSALVADSTAETLVAPAPGP